jgi:DNA-binding NarL/FixJ family response regulator
VSCGTVACVDVDEPVSEAKVADSAAEVITVANIEDVREIREGLAMLIDGTPGFRCIGKYRSMEEALTGIADRVPDVALVDIGLPGMSGIDGIRLLKQRHPRITLLMFTVYDDDRRIFDALCAGASGYLLKKTPPARLLECLEEAARGGSPISPEIARKVIELFRTVRPPDNVDYELTPHEMRLLKLLVEGYSYKGAAAELKISVNTIAFHTKRIYEKLHVHSKSEAVSKALRNRIVS